MTDEVKGKNVHEIISDLYKTRTTYVANPVVSQVQNTVTKILANNPRRLAFVLVNISNVSIFISPDGDVSNSKGIILFPGGGSITLKFLDDLELVSHEWYAIATAPNANIYLLETISQR